VALAGGLLLAALVLAVGEPAAAQKGPNKKEAHKKEPHKKEVHKKEVHKKEVHKKEVHKKELKKGVQKKAVHKAGVSVPAGISEADRLRIREALGHLRLAHQLLHTTRHGFGGHRQAAENDTGHAIRQSEQALVHR
jgi:hypothetical protein